MNIKRKSKNSKKTKNYSINIFLTHSKKKKIELCRQKIFLFLIKKKVFAILKSHLFKKTQKYHLINRSSSFIFSSEIFLYLQKIQSVLNKNFSLHQNNEKTHLYTLFIKDIWKKHLQLLNNIPQTKFLQRRKKNLTTTFIATYTL